MTGLRVLNIHDLANALKPMLMAGEELTVQIVREGKEPGQGVAYLDDGTMIVVENGRRYVGETVTAVVTTVLQTSAGRMIFTRLKPADERPAESRPKAQFSRRPLGLRENAFIRWARNRPKARDGSACCPSP